MKIQLVDKPGQPTSILVYPMIQLLIDCRIFWILTFNLSIINAIPLWCWFESYIDVNITNIFTWYCNDAVHLKCCHPYSVCAWNYVGRFVNMLSKILVTFKFRFLSNSRERYAITLYKVLVTHLLNTDISNTASNILVQIVLISLLNLQMAT